MHRSILAGAILASSVACADMWHGVRGSGHLVQEKRAVKAPFQAVEVWGDATLHLVEGPSSVTVRADDNVLPLFVTRVDDGKLELGPEEHTHLWSSTIEVTVAMPRLSALDVSGDCRVDSSVPTGAALTVEVSGASHLKLSRIQAATLKVDSSGASELKLSGKADEVSLSISGSSELEMKELQAQRLELDVSGASTIHARVSGEVKGDLSGSSELVIAGRPATRVDVSGSSSVITE